MKIIHLSSILPSLVALFLQPGICFAYVCMKPQHGTGYSKGPSHSNLSRIMAEPPSSPENNDAKKEETNRFSIRKRIVEKARSVRWSLPSFRRSGASKSKPPVLLLEDGPVVVVVVDDDNDYEEETLLAPSEEVVPCQRQTRAADHGTRI